ncbi:MAG TPA: hypothetical protein VEL77_15265 [Rugosimonospora sp.]|nr:hypothetical protein [Rugosimonospora sp.]
MADPLLDEINSTTLPEINDAAIEDTFFLGSVFQAHLRAKALVPFKGGAFSRNLQLYNPLNGGAYPKGIGGFNLTKPNTLSSTVFDPRYYVVMIIEYLEDISVLNTGDLAVFSLLETDMANAYQTISAIMALDLQQNGVTGARAININGWVEAVNDGLNPSWDGGIYTSYGTAARNGNVRKTLNGNVYWGGNAAGGCATITYPAFNAMYNLGKRGGDEADLIVGNKPIVSFVENRIQAQQRFGQDGASVRDPYFGAVGFRFKNAMVMMDDYFPSALAGYADASNAGLGNNLTGTIAYVSTASNQINNFPTSNVTLTVGEVLLMLNTSRWRFRVSNDSEFGFNCTDFIRAPDSTRVASQLKAAVNLECTAPWANVQGYGWNS